MKTISAHGSAIQLANGCHFCGNDCEIDVHSKNGECFMVCMDCADQLVKELTQELKKLNSYYKEGAKAMKKWRLSKAVQL